MAKVFISYSRKDIEFAKRLTSELQKSEMDFWIDWEGIPPTVDWWKEIEKGIEEADAFLFIISPDSAKSKICGQEIDTAVKNGKRIIPIVAREIEWQDTPAQLGHLNYIFFSRNDDFDTATKKLTTAIHTDYEWAATHRRLQVKALEWERRNKENSFLLRGKDLQEAEQQLAVNTSKDPHPTDLQREYIFLSRKATDRQRRVTTGISIAGIISLAILAVFGFYQAGQATNNAATAVANEQEAIKQAQIALARQLAAQAQSVPMGLSGDPVPIVLLAIQSMKLFPVSEAAQTLQNNIIWNEKLTNPIIRRPLDNSILSVAFSPNGKYVVSSSEDGSVIVWEAFKAEEVVRMTHEAGVTSVAFSPNGKYILSGGCDIQKIEAFSISCTKGSARIWETDTGSEIARMTHDAEVTFATFSPDGKYVASGSEEDATIIIWEATTGKEIAHLTHVLVSSIAFSPNKSWAVSGGCDSKVGNMRCNKGSLYIWDIVTGNEIAHLVNGEDVQSVVVSPDGKYLVSVGVSDHTNYVRVWDTNTWNEIHSISTLASSVVFSPDGKYMVLAPSSNAIIPVLDTSTWKEIAQLPHDEFVSAFDFSPSGNYAVSGSINGARVWDTTTWNGVIHIKDLGWISSVDFSPDEKYIVSGGSANTSKGTVDVWLWQPEDLISDACARVPRNLTRAEWKLYTNDVLPYQAVCHNLPIEAEVTITPTVTP